MLRNNFLVVLCLGLLSACGPNEPGVGGARLDEPLGQIRAAAALSYSPASLGFGDQMRGTSSAPQSVRVTNPNGGSSSCDLTVTGAFWLVTTSNGSEVLVQSRSNVSVQGNNFRDFPVKFVPTATGSATGTLTIGDCLTGTLQLTGNGTKSAQVAPTSLTFQAQKTNTLSQPLSVEVTNAGPSAFNITGVSATGPFVVTPITTPVAVAGTTGSASIPVTFQPTSTGALTGTLTITTNEQSTLTVQLSGTRVDRATQVSATALPSFGTQRVGTTSTSKTVTVRNAGDTNLTLTATPVTGPFALVPLTSTVVAPGASKDLEVTFNPTEVGQRSGYLTITTDETDPANSSSTVSARVDLSGEGVEPNLVLLKDGTPLSGTTLAFGDVRMGTTKTETVTLRNTGTGPITFSNINRSGSSTFTYTIDPAGTSFTLEPNTERVVTVTYSPAETTTSSEDTGSLTFATDDLGYTPGFAISLTGTGVKPNLVLLKDGTPLSGTTLAFGDVRMTTTKTETVTLRNTGSGPITFSAINQGGSSTFTYGITPPGTSFTLAPNTERVVSVTFSPPDATTSAQVTGSLTFVTDDRGYTPGFAIGFSGTGVKPRIVVNPNPLAFGEQPVGSQRLETVTVSNTGSGPITISDITQSGSSTFTYTIDPAGTAFTLTPGSQRVVSVTYKPTTNNSADSGALTFATQDPTYSAGVRVDFSGKAVTPTLVLDPSPIAFGNLRVRTSLTKTVVLRNDGSGTLYINGISIGSGSHAAFSVVNPPTMPFPLAPGGEQELSVKYNPTAETSTSTPDSGTLVVTGGSFLGTTWATATANLTGRGVKPTLVPNPSPLAFGGVRLDTAKTLTVSVRNNGTGPITFSDITRAGAAFTLDSSPTMPLTLAPGAEQVLSVTYRPTVETTNNSEDTGTLTLATTDLDYGPGFVINLSGKGVRPHLELNPSPLAFGDVRMGTDKTQTITVRNAGTGPITFSSFSTGTSTAFALVNPPSTPFTLAASTEQVLTVRFSPTEDAQALGFLALTSDDPAYLPPSVGVSLSGRGVRPVLALSGTALGGDNTLAFGELRVGSEKTETVTVRNNGTGSITFSSISTGTGTPFTLVTPLSMPFTLAANTEQVLTVRFSPTADAAATGSLTLATSDPGYTPRITVNLTGKGVMPNVVRTPDSFAFGDLRVGTSVTRTVLLKNTGSGPITFSDLTKGGHSAFTLVNRPATPFTLNAGGEQLLTVTYNPTVESTTTDRGTLTLATGDPAYSPGLVIDLTGKGVQPRLVLDPTTGFVFGGVRVGTSVTKTVTVRNSGTGPIVITEVVQSDNSAFTLNNRPATPFTLNAGAEQVLSVTFNPTVERPESATLTLATGDSAYPEGVRINLTGEGVKPVLGLSPNPLAFGDVRTGTEKTGTVTMSNTGTGPITFSSISTGAGTPFTLVTQLSMPFTLAANTTQVLTVKFSPTADAAATDSLTFATTDLDYTPRVTVSLTGKGVRPNLVLDPPTGIAFGDVAVNGIRTQTLTVRNTGTGPITLSSLSIGTTAPFTLDNPPSMPLTLNAGAEQVVTVRFSPTVDAAASATLTLTTQDPGWPSVAVHLAGRGVKANLALSPALLAFGDVRVGTTRMLTVKVRNSGTGPITISSITKEGHPAFSLVEPTGAPFTLAAGGEKDLAVTYSPIAETTTQTPDTGVFNLFTNDPGLPKLSGELTGKGVKPILGVGPNPLAFGPVRVGTEKTATITVSNTGTGPITISSLPISGAPFTFVNPPSTPFTVPAGTNNTRVLTVKFSPTADAPASGTLTLVTDDADYSPGVTVNLTGTGVKPKLVLDPNPLAFGDQIVGTTSTSRTVRVVNTGTGPVSIQNITTAAPFAIISNKTFDLPAGEGADINVTFSPTAMGEVGANLTLVTDEATASALPVRLTGKGISSLKVEPSTLIDFGNVARGEELTYTVTLTNESSAAISGLSLSTVAAPFSVTAPKQTTLSTRGAATTFTVTFRPTADNEQVFSGTLTLTSDASNSPQTFTLRGTCVVPVAKLSLPLPDAAPIASLDFAGVRVNATTQLTVRLSNTGKAPLSFSQKPYLASSSDGGTSVFQYLGPATITIAAGSYIDFQVAFQPAAKINYSDSLIIPSNAVNSPTVLSLLGIGADPELKLDRTSIFFGDVRVGDRSAGVPVTINNTGNAPVNLQNLPVEGPFEVVLPKETDGGTIRLPRTIPVLSSFTFDTVYKPATEAKETGSVSIVTDMIETDAGTLRVSLSGSGTTSRLAMSANTLDFGGQRVRQTSGVLPVVLSNPGKAELEITDFIFSNNVFTISPDAGVARPLKIGAGQQVPVSLVFTPNTLGQAHGQLFVISNAANANDAGTLGLAGKGIDGQLKLTPSVISFDWDGGVEVGGPGAQQSVTITNIGEATLTITNLEPPDGGEFTVSGLPVGQNDAGVMLQPSGEWPITVTFTPQRRGFVSSSAIIRSDSVMNPAFNMSMRGTGVAAAVELLPTDVYFGKSNVGVATAQDIAIKNVGERDLYVSNISFAEVDGGVVSDGGLAALDFSIGTSGDGGTIFPVVVGPGKSSNVSLKFTPREPGMRRARAIVFTNDKATEANLVGEGALPNLTLSPAELDFKNVQMGKPSAARELTITNSGNGPLTLRTMTLGGADATSFILTPPTLPLTLQPLASTKVTVQLSPNAERLFSAQLVVESNDPDSPSVTVSMFGTGVRQQIQLSKSALEFGQQLLNNTSGKRSVLVTNSSDTNVTLNSLTVEGTGASQFTLPTLGLPLVLTPGKEQEVALTFTPLSEAEVNCVLKIAFSDLAQPLEVALHGKGIAEVLSVAPSPLNFGGVRVGSTVRENQLTITNRSSEKIVLAAPEVISKDGEPFILDAASLQGREINPGMSVIITVGYQPKVETFSQTTLAFGTVTPAGAPAVKLQLEGRATNRLLFVDQTSLDFGAVGVKKTLEPKVITVTNKSAQQQRVVVKQRDPTGSPFILDTKALIDPIASGGTATFSVTFDPETAGPAENEVQVWLQGETEAEALISVKGQGTDIKVVQPSGCSSTSTQAGSAAMLALLALVGLGSRRRRRG